MQMLKKPTIIETIRLNRLHWFGHERRMEENSELWKKTDFPKGYYI